MGCIVSQTQPIPQFQNGFRTLCLNIVWYLWHWTLAQLLPQDTDYVDQVWQSLSWSAHDFCHIIFNWDSQGLPTTTVISCYVAANKVCQLLLQQNVMLVKRHAYFTTWVCLLHAMSDTLLHEAIRWRHQIIFVESYVAWWLEGRRLYVWYIEMLQESRSSCFPPCNLKINDKLVVKYLAVLWKCSNQEVDQGFFLYFAQLFFFG